MAIKRPVLFTMVGIVAIGYTLAILAPPQWGLGELILLAACIVLVRERKIVLEEREPRRSNDSFAANSTQWFAGSGACFHDSGPRATRPREFDHAVSSRGPAQSVEQIAHQMLSQAFRQSR